MSRRSRKKKAPPAPQRRRPSLPLVALALLLFGLNRGFDVYDDYYGEKRSFLSFEQLERRADAIVAPAESWIREQSGPWFAWMHLFDYLERFAKEAPPGRYRADIARARDRIREIEKS